MARSRKPAKNAPSDATQRLIGVMVELLLAAGADPRVIEQEIRAASQSLSTKRSRRKSQAAVENISRALSLWHTSPDFVDSRGQPKPLRVRGAQDSLEALICQSNDGRCDANDLRLLTRSASLAPRGRGLYCPADHYVDLKGQRSLLLDFACLAATRLLQTALHNLSAKKQADALIERNAFVVNLPASQLPSFRRFTSSQGRQFIQSVDRWLESRLTTTERIQKSAGDVVAGVHVFGFVDPKRAKPGSVSRQK